MEAPRSRLKFTYLCRIFATSDVAKRALKSANEKLRRSTHHKNLVIWYGYNKYMAHHYAYMTKVAQVREPESYAEAYQDVKW